MVRGLREAAGREIEAARKKAGPFRSLHDLWRRTRLSKIDLSRLAAADALASLVSGASRREALWQVLALPEHEGDLFARAAPPPEPASGLHPLTERERMLADFEALRACVHAHPMELMRPSLARWRVASSSDLASLRPGREVKVAGMAIVRQRPETAHGMFFMTLEDEQGFANIVATPEVFARYRKVARAALFVLVRGKIERSGKVVNVKAEHLEELQLGQELPVATRDFH
jgi:error-prone DNA polymerase